MKYIFKLLFNDDTVMLPDGSFSTNKMKEHFKKIASNTEIPFLGANYNPKTTVPIRLPNDLKRIPDNVVYEFKFLELSRIDANPVFTLDIYDPLRLYENLNESDVYYLIEYTIKTTFSPVARNFTFVVELIKSLDDIMNEEKQSCNFKFPKPIYEALKELSEASYMDMTNYLVQLIIREKSYKTQMSGTSGYCVGH